MMSRLNLGGAPRARAAAIPAVVPRKCGQGSAQTARRSCQRAFAVRHSRPLAALSWRSRASEFLSSGDLTPRGAGGRPYLRRPHWGRRPDCSSATDPFRSLWPAHVAHEPSLGMRRSDRRRRFRSGRVPARRHSHYGEGRSEPRARCAVPAGGDGQRLQRRALVALGSSARSRERILVPLPGRRRHRAPIWRLPEPPSCGPSRRSLLSRQLPEGAGSAAPTMFDGVSSPVEAPTLSSGCELSSSVATATAFSPAAVRFNANASTRRPRRDARQACSAWL